MLDPVEEVRDIIEKLTPERRETLLKYARELYAAKSGEKTDKANLSDVDKSGQESLTG